ncbi:MAG: ANTAR domain-containing response regulator [Desulfitobacteriaceae bacterium]
MKRTILAISKPGMIQEIKSILGFVDYQALAATGNGMEALRLIHRYEPDLMIMGWNLPGLSSLELLQTLTVQHLCPILVVLNSDEHAMLQEVVKADAHQVVFYPLRAIDFGASIMLAEHRFKRERENVDQIGRLEEELKTRKLIYQAVLRLIQLRGWDEETAYTTLRSQAMSLRRSLRSVSQDIVKGFWLPD